MASKLQKVVHFIPPFSFVIAAAPLLQGTVGAVAAFVILSAAKNPECTRDSSLRCRGACPESRKVQNDNHPALPTVGHPSNASAGSATEDGNFVIRNS